MIDVEMGGGSRNNVSLLFFMVGFVCVRVSFDDELIGHPPVSLFFFFFFYGSLYLPSSAHRPG